MVLLDWLGGTVGSRGWGESSLLDLLTVKGSLGCLGGVAWIRRGMGRRRSWNESSVSM